MRARSITGLARCKIELPRLLKKYSTDFENGYVAVVIGESDLDQALASNQLIVHRTVGGAAQLDLQPAVARTIDLPDQLQKYFPD